MLRHSIQNENVLTHEEIARKIADEADITPLTVTMYAGALDPSIKIEARKTSRKMLEEKHDITSRWNKYVVLGLNPSQIIEKIALEDNIKPASIAAYGRFSQDLNIRTESKKFNDKLYDAKHNLTEKWIALTLDNPKLKPYQKAIIIGKDTSLSPATVCGYLRSNSDKNIKKEAGNASDMILDKKYDITHRWIKTSKNHPEKSPSEIAGVIALNLNIKPVSVASYVLTSRNKTVRHEAIKAYTSLCAQKHEIKNL
ncbi:MAG: hypothetical protein ACTSX4_06890 [Candidatus Helarchaeota archaeon]